MDLLTVASALEVRKARQRVESVKIAREADFRPKRNRANVLSALLDGRVKILSLVRQHAYSHQVFGPQKIAITTTSISTLPTQTRKIILAIHAL